MQSFRGEGIMNFAPRAHWLRLGKSETGAKTRSTGNARTRSSPSNPQWTLISGRLLRLWVESYIHQAGRDGGDRRGRLACPAWAPGEHLLVVRILVRLSPRCGPTPGPARAWRRRQLFVLTPGAAGAEAWSPAVPGSAVDVLLETIRGSLDHTLRSLVYCARGELRGQDHHIL